MQVLLRESIAELGGRGDVVTVKSGYARNYLVPKGLAVVVKSDDLKAIELERKRLARIAEKECLEIAELKDKLVDASATITVKANEEGHLFGSVGPEQIAETLTKEVTEVDASTVRLEENIKELGVYEVPIHLSADVEVVVKVYVVGE